MENQTNDGPWTDEEVAVAALLRTYIEQYIMADKCSGTHPTKKPASKRVRTKLRKNREGKK